MTISIKYKTILKKIHRHSVVLFLMITALAIGGVFIFDSSRLQFQILTVLAITYLSWALLHHSLDKSLTLEIMIEYVLTALLTIIILYGTLL